MDSFFATVGWVSALQQWVVVAHGHCHGVARIFGGWWWLASLGYGFFFFVVVVVGFFTDAWILLLLNCLRIKGFYYC